MTLTFPKEIPDAPGYWVDRDGNITGTVTEDVIEEEAVDLADLVASIFARSGLASTDYDVTDLAGIDVIGFVIAREINADGALGPLMAAYLFDVAEWDGKVRCVRRGAAAVAALDVDDLVARDGPPVTEVRDQEIERPRKINVQYFDEALEYAVSKQTEERRADTSAIGERSIELSVVMTADQAKQRADTLVKAAWIDLLGGKDFTLPSSLSYLTPTDNITLTYRGRTERVRIEKVDLDAGQLVVSVRQDRQSAYSSNLTGDSTGDTSSGALGLIGPTIFAFMDIRPLRDADDKLGAYVAVGGMFPGWYGAQVQMSTDSGLTYTPVAQSDVSAAMGFNSVALGYHGAETIDNFNTLTVQLFDDANSLSSITFAQLINEGNGAMLGDEVIQWQTATLTSSDPVTYQLTGLARGRLGTTAAAHAIGDLFVPLASAMFVEIGREWIGRTLTFRAVSLGTTEDATDTQDVTFTGKSQTEYAPVALAGTRDGSSNLALTWSGAGRMGANVTAAHGVYFTGYRITFTVGGTTVTKTSTTESYTYTAADQTTDFGAPQASFTVNVYQLNSITGAGPALTGTV